MGKTRTHVIHIRMTEDEHLVVLRLAGPGGDVSRVVRLAIRAFRDLGTCDPPRGAVDAAGVDEAGSVIQMGPSIDGQPEEGLR